MTINKKNKPSSGKQRQLLAIARQQLDMDRDDYKALMTERYGVDSSTKLTFEQAGELIDYFITKGFVITGTKRRYMKRRSTGKKGSKLVALVSPAELEKIDAVAGLIRWRCEDGMTLWMKKFLKIDKVKTGGDAFRVIEGLKKMFENGMVKAYGVDWWLNEYEDTEINAYIVTHLPARYEGRAVPALSYMSDRNRKTA
jgi:hypothetical protein